MDSISIIGCGWLGLPLGAFLVEQGYEVKGSTTTDSKMELIREKGIRAYLIKVSEVLEGKIEDFFDSEILIINIPPKRRLPNLLETHPKQIKAIIAAAKKGRIKQLIFISSTGVYGNENRTLNENDPLNPVRESGKALVQIEDFLQKEKDLKTTILRMGGLVGGDRKAGRFLAGKKDIPNGKAPINMVHRKDCIHIIHQIIVQKKWGELYNVCADEHPTREAFYKSQAQKEGMDAPDFLEEETATYKIISNEKIKLDLAYKFHFPDPMKFC